MPFFFSCLERKLFYPVTLSEWWLSNEYFWWELFLCLMETREKNKQKIVFSCPTLRMENGKQEKGRQKVFLFLDLMALDGCVNLWFSSLLFYQLAWQEWQFSLLNISLKLDRELMRFPQCLTDFPANLIQLFDRDVKNLLRLFHRFYLM